MQAREYQKENQIPVGGFKPGIKLSSYNIPQIIYLYRLYDISYFLFFLLSYIIARDIYSIVNEIPSPLDLLPFPPPLIKTLKFLPRFDHSLRIIPIEKHKQPLVSPSYVPFHPYFLRLILFNPPCALSTIRNKKYKLQFSIRLRLCPIPPPVKEQSLITHD